MLTKTVNLLLQKGISFYRERRRKRMKNLIQKIRGFIRSEEGQGLVEYALIIALVAIVILVAISLLGRKVSNTYTNISGALPR
jgi:pilus assembly protein Flp/PilA